MKLVVKNNLGYQILYVKVPSCWANGVIIFKITFLGNPRMPPGLVCQRQNPLQYSAGQSARIVGGGVASRNAWNFITKIKICKGFYNTIF